MAKVGHRSDLCQRFFPWPSSCVYLSYVGHLTLCPSLTDCSKSNCQLNFDLTSVCKTCSWNLFEDTQSDLNRSVMKIAALLQSQR